MPATRIFAILLILSSLLGPATAAHGELLVYEPFDYAGAGPVLLSGQGATNTFGMTGTWSTFNNGTANSVTVYPEGTLSGVNLNTGVANIFSGTVANLPTSGGYFGSVGLGGTANTTDHIGAWRTLDPSVTATFTDGSTTWFSVVTARAFNLNATATRFAIGAGELLEDRGHLAAGEAIGVGGGFNSTQPGGSNTLKIFPQFWDDTQTAAFNNHNVLGVQVTTGAATTNSIQAGDFFPWATTDGNGDQSVPNIIIGKIEWSDSGPDVISIARFLETDVLSEAAFDLVDISSAGWSLGADLDQSLFDTISFQGGRYFADELRIGTTFNDVIGQSSDAAVPEPAGIAVWSLIGLALCGFGYARRQRRK